LEDIARIRKTQPIVAGHVDELVEGFFSYLAPLQEAAGLFARPDLLEEAKRRKRQHVMALVNGEYGRPYIEERLQLGVLYSKARLDPRVFLGAFQELLNAIGLLVVKANGEDLASAFESFLSIKRLAFLDLGVIVDVLMADRERTIRRQQQALLELSTPVLQLRERLLILPIIGMLDSQRAKQLTDGLLHAIRAHRAKAIVMDITGVAAVDSKVADHLIKAVTASRLMGATVVITGLSADVAQSLVAIGVDLSKLNAVGDLQEGLEEAERFLGYELVKTREQMRLSR
jgi:rsbT co-antagonist protein RsbR